MADCFWTNRVGVEEDCGDGGGGTDLLPGAYVYALVGGLYSSKQEVRRFRADGSTPLGVRVAGSGFNDTSPESLYRATGLTAQFVFGPPRVELYIGEYSYTSVWNDGALQRESKILLGGGDRQTASAFDGYDALYIALSDYRPSPPSTPPPTFTNCLYYPNGIRPGIGDGDWARGDFDTDSMNGVCSIDFDWSNDAAYTIDMCATPQFPYFQGRVLRWNVPYGNAIVVSEFILAGGPNADPTELINQVSVVDGYAYYVSTLRNTTESRNELAIHRTNSPGGGAQVWFFGSLSGTSPISPYSSISGFKAVKENGVLVFYFVGRSSSDSLDRLIRLVPSTASSTVIGTFPDIGNAVVGKIAYVVVPN